MYWNSCDNETTAQHSGLAVARASASLTCFGLGLFILALVCARRLFKTALQRQYLYLLLSTEAYLLVLGAGADGIFADYRSHNDPCVAIGFLTQWASITELFFTFSIIVFMHVKILRNHAQPVRLCCGLLNKVSSTCTRLSFEAAFVILSIASPPVLDWMPFSDHSYGLAGAWCWIVSLDDRKNCTDTGFVYQLGLQYVPIIFTSASCVALTVSTNVVLCSAACSHKETSNHHSRRARETTLLLLCIALSFSLVIPEIITRTIIHRYDSSASVPYFVFMLYAVGTPLGRLVLSFDLLLYLYSINSMGCGGGVASRRCRSRCCKRRYNLLDVEEDDTDDGEMSTT